MRTHLTSSLAHAFHFLYCFFRNPTTHYQTVDRYDGAHGEVVRAHFINEAAYYLPSSGLGFELSQEAELPLWGEEAKAERISALLSSESDGSSGGGSASAKKRKTK